MRTKTIMLVLCTSLAILVTLGAAQSTFKPRFGRFGAHSTRTSSSRDVADSYAPEDLVGPVELLWDNDECDGKPTVVRYPYGHPTPFPVGECDGSGSSRALVIESNHLVEHYYHHNENCEGRPDYTEVIILFNQCYNVSARPPRSISSIDAFNYQSYAYLTAHNDTSPISAPHHAFVPADIPLPSSYPCTNATEDDIGCNGTLVLLDSFEDSATCGGNFSGQHFDIPYDTCMFDSEYQENVVFRCTPNGARFDYYIGECSPDGIPDRSYIYVADPASSTDTHAWATCRSFGTREAYREGCLLPPKEPSTPGNPADPPSLSPPTSSSLPVGSTSALLVPVASLFILLAL